MVSDWELRSLGELANLHREQINPLSEPRRRFCHFSLPAFDKTGEPLIELGASIASCKFTVPANSVLVSKLNPRFPRVWLPDPEAEHYSVASTEFLVLLPRPGVHRRFLKYLCLSPAVRAEMEAMVTGTSGSHQRVRPADVLSITANVPVDPAERNAIADILSALDDKIELNRRMNATLESLARAIFKSWFVNFDPVRWKAEGGNQQAEKNHSSFHFPPSTLKLFPSTFQDSELGKIPQGWTIGSLSDIGELRTASVHPNKAPEILWEHYSIPAFDSGNRPAFDLGSEIKSNKYAVPVNCVLVSKLNPQFPRVWIPDVQNEDAAICSTEFMPFVPREPSWRPFLYECIFSDAVQTDMLNRATGSTGSRQRVRPREVTAIELPIPTEGLIKGFCEIVGPMHDHVIANIRESSALGALRDTLLPKLLSGELPVPAALTTTEEALA